MKARSRESGKLRIGDDWNAIRIIALSQSNPLKAIKNFAGLPADQLLERMIELSLYAEEKLKSG
jgi:hypothetical protein